MQPFDKKYVCDIAKQILTIDSPTGYTKRAIDFMDEEAKKLGFTYAIAPKTHASDPFVRGVTDMRQALIDYLQ